ncbi:hypothetical protein [Vibrio injensis]|uniref:hypothetical protein n=1 Tax=Vibrio injensis TaxID=1307414 RepID=UPI0009345111|nr:hypothetical protein [Vibrio injensis]
MSYGLSIYDLDKSLNISSGWFPMSYKGTMTFQVKYLSSPTITQEFDIPAGCLVFVQPAGPAVRHIAYTDSFGTVFSGYVLRTTVSGSLVSISQELWYGYSSSPLNNQYVSFNIYAYYPVTSALNDYGILLAGSGVSVALSNTSRLNVVRFKTALSTSSKELTVSTGIPASETAPSVYISDSGFNAIACYLFQSQGVWHVMIMRAGGRYYVDFTYTEENPRSGEVKVIAFGDPPQSVPEYGMAFFGDDGGVAFRSDFIPEMPRGYLSPPSPVVNPPGSAGWHSIGDSNAQMIPDFSTKKPMIKARLIGISKLSGLPFPVSTWLKSNGSLTCGVLRKGQGSLPVGGFFGYWGENSNNSPIMYIHEDDYF